MSEPKSTKLRLYTGQKKVGTVFKSNKKVTITKGDAKGKTRTVGRCYKIVKAKMAVICPDEQRKKPYKKRTKKTEVTQQEYDHELNDP